MSERGVMPHIHTHRLFTKEVSHALEYLKGVTTKGRRTAPRLEPAPSLLLGLAQVHPSPGSVQPGLTASRGIYRRVP